MHYRGAIMAKQFQTHPFGPVFDKNSKILILGSFPSIKSREMNFFYGHPQNRFWKVVSRLLCEEEPQSVDEKKAFLLRNRIALWDSIASCEIENSADNTIEKVKPNDISIILKNADIEEIFCNGQTSWKYYHKYIEPIVNIKATALPSTSPANAAWSFDRLCQAWEIIKKEL
jgi:hypoxanthine-DNA glycosylase